MSSFMRLYRLWRSSALAQRAANRFSSATDYIPPFLTTALKYAFAEWEYLPDGWPKRGGHIEGWNDSSIAAAQEKHWPTLVENLRGSGPLGVSHFPWRMTRENRADHNAMMSYGYVLARAARTKDTVSILDWGGGVGHYHLYSRALLPEIHIDYHCYDVPSLCRLGRTLSPEVHFHEDESELCRIRFDLVISSSSLHYFENWRETVRSLAGVTREFLYIARLQTIQKRPSFVVTQRPYRVGYNTEYASWFLNRQELLNSAVESDLELVREFVYAEDWYVRNAPEQGDCRGFLFRRRTLEALPVRALDMSNHE